MKDEPIEQRLTDSTISRTQSKLIKFNAYIYTGATIEAQLLCVRFDCTLLGNTGVMVMHLYSFCEDLSVHSRYLIYTMRTSLVTCICDNKTFKKHTLREIVLLYLNILFFSNFSIERLGMRDYYSDIFLYWNQVLRQKQTHKLPKVEKSLVHYLAAAAGCPINPNQPIQL